MKYFLMFIALKRFDGIGSDPARMVFAGDLGPDAVPSTP
jgi:hypothetical protein